MEIAIGTKFRQVTGKNRPIETVVDIHTTYNRAGEIVKVRYVCTHELMGQIVTDREVVATTIMRSEIITS